MVTKPHHMKRFDILVGIMQFTVVLVSWLMKFHGQELHLHMLVR